MMIRLNRKPGTGKPAQANHSLELTLAGIAHRIQESMENPGPGALNLLAQIQTQNIT